MRDSELVHVVQLLPCLVNDVEQVHFTVSVGVLTTDQDNLVGGDSESATSPKWVLHSHC